MHGKECESLARGEAKAATAQKEAVKTSTEETWIRVSR